jgi:hypothetical protein
MNPSRGPPAARVQKLRLRLRARRPRRLPLFLKGFPPAPAPAPKALPPPRSDQGSGALGAKLPRYSWRSPLGGENRGPSLRRGRSSAVLTRSLRPSTSWPSKRLIASAASASLENSTKANPRERPVSLSVPMWTFLTCPAPARASESCCSVVRKLRLPTKTLVEMAKLLCLVKPI